MTCFCAVQIDIELPSRRVQTTILSRNVHLSINAKGHCRPFPLTCMKQDESQQYIRHWQLHECWLSGV